jgi:phosphatidylinositol glycan class H protein
MLTTAPHLRTRRPSPTTVEYTVSTSPILTVPLRLLLLTTLLLRVSIVISVLLLLYSKYLLSPLSTPLTHFNEPPPFFTDEYIWHFIYLIVQSPAGCLASSLAQQTPVIVLLPISLAILYTSFLRLHTTESLLVLRGLGIQTSSSAETYLSTATTRFIPTEKIQDILVNEAFRGFEVRYYLTVVVDGEEDVVVVFPRLLPRRAIVEGVWRGVRGALFEPGEGREKG